MFVNGENVNYLMLSGEVFSSQSALPRFYRFKRDLDKNSKPYSLLIDSNNNFAINLTELTFFLPNMYFDNRNKVPVYKIIKYKNIEYALVSCIIRPGSGVDAVDASKIIYGQFWIRTSDAGGCTPL